MANLLRHERFERAGSLAVAKPPHSKVLAAALRRRKLPPNVTAISSVTRLRIGALAEIVPATSLKRARDTEPKQNHGKRVRITHHDHRTPFNMIVESLDGPLALDKGGRGISDIGYRPANLRRVWIGLTANERIRLRMRRES